MLKRIRKNRGGFTLVEIMIVVAIIALLAAIAAPGFLRARKRSQATAIRDDVRILDAAKDQYGIENARYGSASVQPAMLAVYLKPGTRLYNSCSTGSAPLDLLGANSYILTTFDTPVQVSPATIANFTDVIDSASLFWGGYGS